MIRLADVNDLDKVFTWRNHPAIVALSTKKQTVTYFSHQIHFHQVLADPNKRMWIVEPDAGVVTIEKYGRMGRISIFLMPDHQGKGLGTKAIIEASRQAFEAWVIVTNIVARIRNENEPSRKSFARAGYVFDRHSNDDHVEFILWRPTPGPATSTGS